METFHRGFFVTRNVVLALSGDFVAEDARTELNAHFGDWKGGRAPKMKQAAPVETAPGRQIHTYPLDTRQAWIAIGHEISPVSQEARPALDVMNYIRGCNTGIIRGRTGILRVSAPSRKKTCLLLPIGTCTPDGYRWLS